MLSAPPLLLRQQQCSNNNEPCSSTTSEMHPTSRNRSLPLYNLWIMMASPFWKRERNSPTKVQIPLGPVPRNFLVANVTKKLRASYRLVTRKLTTSRGSYEELVPVEFGLKQAKTFPLHAWSLVYMCDHKKWMNISTVRHTDRIIFIAIVLLLVSITD